jgi:hypothetical protein
MKIGLLTQVAVISTDIFKVVTFREITTPQESLKA